MGNVLGNTVATMTTGKRTKNVLTWDEYFMSVAFLSGQRSKDPATQVGACIVNMDKRIAGIGYNGMPNQCSDDNMPWAKSDPNNLETKGHYVCHAELNAIVNKLQADIKGCKMYVSLYPCNECAKLIIQSGIKEVIYFSDKYHDRVSSQAARRLFKEADVKTTNYAELSQRTKVDIDFEAINSPF